MPALEQAERRSAEMLDLRRQLREVEDQILDLSDGLTLDAALQEMPGTAPKIWTNRSIACARR